MKKNFKKVVLSWAFSYTYHHQLTKDMNNYVKNLLVFMLETMLLREIDYPIMLCYFVSINFFIEFRSE